MESEIEEIKRTCVDYIKILCKVSNVRLVSAKREETHWKVIVCYSTEDDPYTLSMLMMNKETKEIDYFKEELMKF